MDSTQDPFTRRMLQRAASVRKNREGSLRCGSYDSRRRLSILQAIGDKPVKITDVEDGQVDKEASVIGENIFAEDKQRSLRKSNFTTSDSLISTRSDLPNFYRRVPNSSSRLTDPQNPQESLNSVKPQRISTDSDYVVQNIGENKLIGKEDRLKDDSDRNRRKSAVFEVPKLKTTEATVMKQDEETNKLPANKNNATNEDREHNSSVKMMSDKNHNESYKNNLNLTQTFNSTSLNLTGNSTKDSISSSTYVKGFELGNVKWRGPLYTACTKWRNRKDRDFIEKNPSEIGDEMQPYTARISNAEIPKLLKVEHREIWTPPKMRAELTTIGGCGEPEVQVVESELAKGADNSCGNRRPDRLPLLANADRARPEVTGKFSSSPAGHLNSPITPLTAEIKQLDAEIERLDFRKAYDSFTPDNVVDLSPPTRIYPNLTKIKFTPTGYSPKKLYQSPRSPEEDKNLWSSGKNDIVSDFDNESANERTTENSKTPRNADLTESVEDATKATAASEDGADWMRFVKNSNKVARNDKFKPNLESTRKSSFTDISKNTASPSVRETTVSTVTIPPKSPESWGNVGGNSSVSPEGNNLMNSTLPYDVDNFLADALGDELYNTTVTYPPSEAHDKSVSQFNASELVSEERTPLQKKSRRFFRKTPMTEPPPQHTSTFNRTMTIYRSLTQRIKNKLRPGLRAVPKTTTKPSDFLAMQEHSTCGDKRIQALLQEANIQHTLMYQANKALTLCRATKEFMASTEQVESERSLLVATLRRAAALEEIRKLQDQELNNNIELQLRSWERGEVLLKDFSFALKEDVLQGESQSGDVVQWFVVTVSYGQSVWATRPISCPVQSPRIIFPGAFLIPNLTPNFRITVGIYSLKMRRPTFNYDDKYHLNKTEKHSRCPSPKELLKKSEKPLSPKKLQMEFSDVKNTSFVLAGMLELHLHDLTLTAPWPLSSLAPGTVLGGTIDLTLSCKLHLSVSHAGFLTLGDEAGGFATWNRRWCVLQGQSLMFWNYPCDQEDKEPLATIDLTNCISEEVTVADRSLCAKPRTLLIETARRRSALDRNSMILDCRLSCTIVRNLLCCDTTRELSQWKAKLNRVISALRDWNVTSPPFHVQVSDL